MAYRDATLLPFDRRYPRSRHLYERLECVALSVITLYPPYHFALLYSIMIMIRCKIIFSILPRISQHLPVLELHVADGRCEDARRPATISCLLRNIERGDMAETM